MKILFRYWLLILVIGNEQRVLAQKLNHVVLISIDGFRPEFYLNSSWPVPNLRKIMGDGVFAIRMKSVFPSYTYPAHAAMVSGALPARSGIFYNKPRNSKGEWNWHSDSIKVNTLWKIVRLNGLTTAAIQWPLTVGAEIDYNIPEIWDIKTPEDRITVSRKFSTPGLVDEIEAYATGKLDSINMNEGFMGLDDNAGRTAAYIFGKYKPNFLAVHFAGVDGKQHEYGKEHFWVHNALSNVDHAIGEILEAVERSPIKENTTIIVVGDHGFCNIKYLLRPNQWIEGSKASFKAAGGAAFLYVNEGSDIEKVTVEVRNKLKNLPNKFKKCFEVLNKDELLKMGVDSGASLAISAMNGIVFSDSFNGEQMTEIHGGHHGYNPNMKEMYSGFLATGFQIRKGKSIFELEITDIAPLVAKLLGCNYAFPDGVLIKGILND